ncbi:MAG: FHA domain-containing protein [Pseudomonadota bacterium]
MVKIIVTYNGLIQQELSLAKPRITIGRRPSNDLVIDHLTVSGQHAAIDTSSQGSFILDLGSTNGTMINGQPIKKHLLQNDDVIEIGKYKLRVMIELQREPAPAQAAVQVHKDSAATQTSKQAKIKIINGVNAGKELSLTKAVTTLGSPSVQVVAITLQNQTYFVNHVEGNSPTLVNDKPINSTPIPLADGDTIELSGTKMLFSLSP